MKDNYVLNIVTNMGEGWIIPKYAKLLRDKYPSNVTINSTIQSSADVNLLLPYYNDNPRKYKTNNRESKTKIISYFTHYEEHKDFQHRRDQWMAAMNHSDLCLTMSAKYAQLILDNAKHQFGKVYVVHLPVLTEQVGKLTPKKKVIGISTRHYPSDRKGAHLIKALKANEWFNKYFELKETTGNIKPEDMNKWYHSLDYYLVTSTVEGGPMGLIEARLANVPVIAPSDVGFCMEYGTYIYTKNTLTGTGSGLLDILQAFVHTNMQFEDRFSEKYWIVQMKHMIEEKLK